MNDSATIALVEQAPKAIYISPSQIHTSELCLRKWAWKYVAKLPEPQSPSQTAGLELHKRVELWLGKGAHPGNDAIGKLVQAAIRPGILPTPSRSLRLEAKFELPIAPSVCFTGYIDCLVPPGETSRTAIVIDHKSTSNLRWAKSVAELQHDPQVVGYAKAALDWYREANAVECRWVYYQRNTTRVHPVALTLDAKTVAERWSIVVSKALKLAQLRVEAPDPNNVPANPEACDVFGGCPYAQVCFARGQTRSFFPERKLFTLDANNATAQDPTPGAATTGDPNVISLQEQLSKLRAGMTASKETPKAVEQQAPSSLGVLQAADGAKGVNPPAQTSQDRGVAAPPQSAEGPSSTPAPLPWSAPRVEAPARSSETTSEAPTSSGSDVAPALPWLASKSAETSIERAEALRPSVNVAEPLRPATAAKLTEASATSKVLNSAARTIAERQAALKQELEALEAKAAEEARERAEAEARALAELQAAEQARMVAEAKAKVDADEAAKTAKKSTKRAPKEREVEEITVEVSRSRPHVRGLSQEFEETDKLLTVCFGIAWVKAPTLLLASTVNLVELLTPLMQEVADANGVAHWNLVPYAQGKSLLAVAFDKWLTDTNWKGTILVGASDEAFAVREVLIAHADLVLQGTRA